MKWWDRMPMIVKMIKNLENNVKKLSAEILQARRKWQDIVKVLKGKNP